MRWLVLCALILVLIVDDIRVSIRVTHLEEQVLEHSQDISGLLNSSKQHANMLDDLIEVSRDFQIHIHFLEAR